MGWLTLQFMLLTKKSTKNGVTPTEALTPNQYVSFSLQRNTQKSNLMAVSSNQSVFPIVCFVFYSAICYLELK